MKQIHVPIDPTLPSPREAAERLRRKLQDTSEGCKFNASLLYDWLIRPIETELTDHAIHTLIIAPDGPLRLIPFSALYDEREERFLIQKYALVTVPTMTLHEPEPTDLEKAQILLNGLSQKHNLPWVAKELKDINNIMGRGRILLNEDYTLDNLTHEMADQAYALVHIATHADSVALWRRRFWRPMTTT